MEFGTFVFCSKCQQPIVSGEDFGFVCFKIPGQVGYHFFHRRFSWRRLLGSLHEGKPIRGETTQRACAGWQWPWFSEGAI
jgi:hypothetical protein